MRALVFGGAETGAGMERAAVASDTIPRQILRLRQYKIIKSRRPGLIDYDITGAQPVHENLGFV